MEETDESIIEQYLQGNFSVFKILVEKYTPLLYSYVRRIGGGAYTEDIVQESFINAWKQINHFDTTKASFKTWLFRITRNKTIDILRKKQHYVFSDLDTNTEEDDIVFEQNIPDTQDLPDVIFQQHTDIEILKSTIDELPEQYKTVLVLHYENDMTFEAIGLILAKPPNTVKSWHRRAIMALREKLHQKISE
ncbi:MAG: RNA polymerase sigma factor [bacterium]